MGVLLAIALLVLGSAAPLGRCQAHEPKAGAEADPITDVLGGARPTIDVRARYGYAAKDGRSSSDAATIRLRLGLETPEVKGVTFFAEFEHTEAADRNSYQAASVHGLGENKTVIADSESSELNRLWISLSGFDSNVKLGKTADRPGRCALHRQRGLAPERADVRRSTDPEQKAVWAHPELRLPLERAAHLRLRGRDGAGPG